MTNPPKGTIKHKIVLSYHNEIRVYCELEKDIKLTKELQNELQEYKIKLLEDALGYKIQKLEDMFTHDEYKKQMVQPTE